MKYEFKLPFYLAFQSIRRGRKWTLILTVILMSVAFINLVFVSALFNGIVEGSNSQIINTLTSDIYLVPKQGSEFIENKDVLIDRINEIEGVDSVTSGFQIPARMEYNSISGVWQIIAISPSEYSTVFDISQKMYAGRYLEDSDEDGIIIGRQIAGGKDVEMNSSSLKGIKVGDRLNIVFDGKARSLKVKGIFYSKFIMADSRAFITDRTLRNIMPNIRDMATTINIKTLDGQQDNVLVDIESLNSPTISYPWSEAAGIMKSVSSSFTSINILMTVVGAIIAAVTTFIVVYVDIVNRRRQIGILRAIGIKPYIIIFSYVILAAIYATLGVFLGSLIFSLILVPYFNVHPFELPIVDAVLNLSWLDYIARVEIISWVAVISGLIPAVIVTRAKMLDAIIGR